MARRNRNSAKMNPRSGAVSKPLLAALAILIVAAVGIWFFTRPRVDVQQTLTQLRTAVGQIENLEVDPAQQTLLAIQPLFPDDPSLQQNLAVNAVSRLRQLAGTIDNVSLDPEVVEAARQQFPAAVSEAQQNIDSFAALAGENAVAAWLHSRLLQVQASQVDPSQATQLAAENVRFLTDTLAEHPDWLTLVGPLTTALDESSDDSLSQSVLPTLIAASEANPRNLYAVMQAISVAVKQRDPAATGLLQRSKQLAEPLVPETSTIAASLGMEPLDVADRVIQAIADDDWQQAGLYTNYWINLHKGTAAYRTDLRLATPHELDFLSFDLSRRLGAQWAAADRETTPPIPIGFDIQSVTETAGTAAKQVAWVDFDIDGTAELAVLDEDGLSILQREDERWQRIATATVPADSQRFVVADLFLVDSSDRNRLRKSRVQTTEVSDARRANQHDTFRSFVVSGPAGVTVLQANPEATDPQQRLREPEKPTNLESISGVTASIACDIDADGDIDLVFGTETEGVQIWINRGNMTFFPVAAHSQLPPSDNPAIDFAFVDFDRDLDLDLLTVLRDGTVGVLENLLHLQFRWQPKDWQSGDGGVATRIAVGDIDGNVSWDPIIAAGDGLQVVFSETSDIGVWKEIGRAKSPLAGAQFVTSEFNNDAWLDLVAWNEAGFAIDSLGFDGVTTSLGEFAIESGAAIRDVSPGDWDGDGRIDLAVASDDGVWIASNTTQGTGNYLRASFKGIDDNASGRVNHYAIGSVLELRYGPYYRAQVITEPISHFGMGTESEAITLRAILPNGVTQSVVQPAANQILYEQQTLKGSCPYLYSWDGEKFAFVTDCLWAAPLGLQVAPGKVVPDRPWEYLKVDGRFVQPRDGFYELRITEELWELAYFDHLQLTAIDHPADVEIFTNEKVGPPSIAEHKIHALDQDCIQPVRSAVDSSGDDVTNLLKHADEDYVQGFREQYCQGLCVPHWIELDLADIDPAAERLSLVLTGWIFPTDTTLNIQIAQNPDLASVVYPVLEVPDGNGGWQTAIPYIGFPGGKTKTIVVDITGKLNPDDRRVRIRTSAQIYWDQAVVAVDPPEVETRQYALNLQSASLGFHGYSAQLPRQSTQPHRYDYEDVATAPKWPPLSGTLTQYGDVLAKLTKWDDDMVVMAAGDEMRLRFPVPDAPIPAGWKRDFVLHCVGWDKDADLHTLAGQTTGPLPFRAMSAYPPPITQVGEAEAAQQRNAATQTRSQRYREFWQRPAVPGL
ncbi:CRTAC1 family protein [Rosistilla oblonga]|uniref:CRTAC1 family protein n=1 Tax=Rosistilla oblonga TaxID=2527990 RepID=UPI0011A53734|nr:CRTAC1 family protein [Rosistilla oblonga]